MNRSEKWSAMVAAMIPPALLYEGIRQGAAAPEPEWNFHLDPAEPRPRPFNWYTRVPATQLGRTT